MTGDTDHTVHPLLILLCQAIENTLAPTNYKVFLLHLDPKMTIKWVQFIKRQEYTQTKSKIRDKVNLEHKILV